MAKRQVFFSFHYNRDSWRASQVRNMGKVDGNSTFSDNDWEEVRYKSDTKIKEWIDKQLAMRSCLVVLVGYETSERKWVKYEIEKAMELLWAVTIEKARSVMKLTATGIVSDFHRCSLFILGD